MRRAIAEVLDTWSDVTGLRGSGSHGVRVAEARVPADFICGFNDRSRIDRPAFRLKFGLYALLNPAAVPLGAARTAADALIEQASGRVSIAIGGAWPGVSGP